MTFIEVVLSLTYFVMCMHDYNNLRIELAFIIILLDNIGIDGMCYILHKEV